MDNNILELNGLSLEKLQKLSFRSKLGISLKNTLHHFDKVELLNELFEMEKRLNVLNEQLENGINDKDYESKLQKYYDLLERFGNEGGYQMNSDIEKVISGLKIDNKILEQSYNDLSGGEKTLVQLAKALLIKPDLLLLDEPTNHLDIERIEWLENYIKSFKGASVIVSHDRYFLDKMSNKILDLDDGAGKVYSTNYSGFLEEKQRDLEKQMADFKDQQALIKKLEAEKKYFAERGMATNSSTLTNRAHTLQGKIDKLKQMAVARPKKQRKLNIGFSEDKKSSQRVITAEGVTVTDPEGNKILDNIDLNVRSGERVALIGANGSGKSTFVKSVAGEQDLPVKGNIIIGPSVKIGYLPQIINFPKGEQKLLDYFRDAVGLDEQKARQILAGFQFYQEDVNKRVGNLSGGERMRIKIAELLQQKINTLIFDEPTNHIDISTKEMLEDALEEFDGTLVFVSHDRYFINKFADRVIEFKGGKAKSYIGNYDDYKRAKERENRDDYEQENPKKAEKKPSKKNHRGKDDDWER